MKTILKLIFILVCNLSFAQTNLLNTYTWTEGTGTVGGFNQEGTDLDNTRELGDNPYGGQSVIWKSSSISRSYVNAGWSTDYLYIDHTKSYRYSIWVKKEVTSAYINIRYYALDNSQNDAALGLDGKANSSNFLLNNYRTPNAQDWYLVVGYIHSSGYTLTTGEGAVYNTDGFKANDISNSDIKFSNTATRLKLWNYLYLASTYSNSELLTYGPTLYEINGEEPTIRELVEGGQPNIIPGTVGNWALNDPNIYYNDGHVGIGTDQPEYSLDVNSQQSAFTARFNQPSIATNSYNTVVFEAASASVRGYLGIGGTGVPDVSFRDAFAIGTQTNHDTYINTNDIHRVKVDGNSGDAMFYHNMGIGVESAQIPADARLAVDGQILAEEIKVRLRGEDGTWPDYVFKKDYKLPSLKDVEKHIEKKGHLLNIPSAKDVKANGLLLGVMNVKLLEKIEELTLYTIQQQKEIESQKAKNETLEERLEKLEGVIEK